MSKLTKAVLFSWMVGLTLLFLLAYFLFGSHSLSLWQLNRSLNAVVHPRNTQRVVMAQDLGLLFGNGDHCDYFVAELRTYGNTKLTPSQIRAFYAKTRIWNPLNRRKQPIFVAVIENGALKTNADPSDTPAFLRESFRHNLPRKLQNQKLYIVFFLDIGNSVGCDIRCI